MRFWIQYYRKERSCPLTGERKGIVILFIFPLMLFLYKYTKTHLGTMNLKEINCSYTSKIFLIPSVSSTVADCDYLHLKYGKEICNESVRYDTFLLLSYN